MRSLSKDGDRKKNEAYEEEERDSGPCARGYGCLKSWSFRWEFDNDLAGGPCEQVRTDSRVMKRYSSCFGQQGFGFRNTRSSTVMQTDVSKV